MPQADTPHPENWEKLNAFADGELAPADQRAMAERLAGSPDAAERLRGIVRLKQELRALPADEAPPLPALIAAPRPRWRQVAAIAAALVIATAVALAPMLLLRDTSGTFVAASLAAHEQFASSAPPPAAPSITPAAALPVTRELARLGLEPIWQATSATGQVRIGFVGARGCRLSLHVSPQAEPAPAPDQAVSTLAGWNAGGRGYLLIATGMPPARFEMIAGFIKALTSEPADRVEPLRTALQSDWRSAQPCLA
ncbi:anti-sigma factor family protein [Bosea sp. LjRoot237]|uniref:anti-sigma factor family protein n=1 Tax=Bosea sp. LjRoot237 TaxID=3342292 RepID=UPI003ECE0CB1